jgi:hypothetical protein
MMFDTNLTLASGYDDEYSYSQMTKYDDSNNLFQFKI